MTHIFIGIIALYYYLFMMRKVYNTIGVWFTMFKQEVRLLTQTWSGNINIE